MIALQQCVQVVAVALVVAVELEVVALADGRILHPRLSSAAAAARLASATRIEAWAGRCLFQLCSCPPARPLRYSHQHGLHGRGVIAQQQPQAGGAGNNPSCPPAAAAASPTCLAPCHDSCIMHGQRQGQGQGQMY